MTRIVPPRAKPSLVSDRLRAEGHAGRAHREALSAESRLAVAEQQTRAAAERAAKSHRVLGTQLAVKVPAGQVSGSAQSVASQDEER